MCAKAAVVRVSALSARAGILEDWFAQAQAQARDAVQRETQARADAADLHAQAGTLEMKIALLVNRCAAHAAERDGARGGSESEAVCTEPVSPALVAEFRRAVAQDYARRCDIRSFVAYPWLTWLQSGEGARTRMELARIARDGELRTCWPHFASPLPLPPTRRWSRHSSRRAYPNTKRARLRDVRPCKRRSTSRTDKPLSAYGPAAVAMPWSGPARFVDDMAPDADGAAPVHVKHERDVWDDRVFQRRRLDDPLAVQVQAPAPIIFDVKQEATYELGGEDLDEASVLVYPDSPGEFSPQAADEARDAQPASPALGPPTLPPQGSIPPLPSPVQAPAQDAPPRLSIKHLPLVYQDVGGHFRCRLCMCVSCHLPVIFVPSPT
jgi:hypothetical protein